MGTPSTPITRPIRWGPALRVMIVITAGMIIPPPMPCRTRNRMSEAALHASPDATEPITNSSSDHM